MLQFADTNLLLDVRTFPRSRTNPVFNIDTLAAELAKLNINYQHCAGLGGRRKKQAGVDSNLNAMWRVQAFIIMLTMP